MLSSPVFSDANPRTIRYDRRVEQASWFQELKRRRVFRALIGYGIVAFAVLQVIEPVMHGLGLPDWVLSVTVTGLGLGFAVTLVLAWVFDLKGGRIERTGPAPRARLLITLVVAGVALGAPGIGWYFWKNRGPAASSAQSASIAVLPFADLSPGKDQDWMCDGIAEEIALCTVTGLGRVANPVQFRKDGDGRQVMARTLGVSTLLEGSVRKVDDRLRVSARRAQRRLRASRIGLRSAAGGRLRHQEEIARSVVSALRVRMLPARRAGCDGAGPPPELTRCTCAAGTTCSPRAPGIEQARQ